MFEVLPNWHPLFVHFAVALLSMSTLFFVALKIPAMQSFNGQLKILAYWNLWFGTGFAIVTAIAGWFAYNSVAHDTPSHEAMTDHRNWALATLSVYIVIALWSLKQFKGIKSASITFTIAIILASALLVSTGWRGSEVVYRYGLGVMSLPKVEGEGHAHEHADGEGHSSVDVTKVNEPTISDGHAHEHSGSEKQSPGSHKYSIDEHGKNERLLPESHKDAISDHDNTPHMH